MKTITGNSILAVLLLLMLTNVVAAQEHLATAGDALGNRLDLSSNTKANRYILKSHSFYGGDEETFSFSPEEMKALRVAYKEARVRLAKARPGFEGTLASRRLGTNGVFSFTTVRIKGDRPDRGMILRWDENKDHSFFIPLSWDPANPYVQTLIENKATWEALLEQTNY